VAESNFQDVVVLSSATLQVRGQAISLGTDAGAKTVVFANDVGAINLAANPAAATNNISLPNADGTLGLITAISAGTTLVSNGQVVLSNSNGLSFGVNGSTITASYTQSTGPAAISAGTTLASSGTVVFSNSNNFSFGMNGNTVTASFSQSVQPGVTAIGVSTGGNTAGNTGTTQGTYVLAGAGAITLSQSTNAGSLATLSISVTLSTAPGGIAAGTQTATSGTVLFSNSNGISFGMSNSSVVTASADYVRSISAGTTNATGNQIVFSNSNNISFGANGATITASFSNTATGIAIAAGTQTQTSGTAVLSNSNGFTFGMSNSSVITATYEQRVTVFSQWADFLTNNAVNNGSLSFQKVSMPMHLSVTQAALLLSLSGTSNSSGALTISMGVYTMSGSTASLASSGSRQVSWTSGSATSATSQFGGASGIRYRSVGINLSLTPGDYLFAYLFSTTNNGTWRAVGRQGPTIVGSYDGNIENSIWLDGGSASSSGAFPASINRTNTNYVRTGANALMTPGAILIGTL